MWFISRLELHTITVENATYDVQISSSDDKRHVSIYTLEEEVYLTRQLF